MFIFRAGSRVARLPRDGAKAPEPRRWTPGLTSSSGNTAARESSVPVGSETSTAASYSRRLASEGLGAASSESAPKKRASVAQLDKVSPVGAPPALLGAAGEPSARSIPRRSDTASLGKSPAVCEAQWSDTNRAEPRPFRWGGGLPVSILGPKRLVGVSLVTAMREHSRIRFRAAQIEPSFREKQRRGKEKPARAGGTRAPLGGESISLHEEHPVRGHSSAPRQRDVGGRTMTHDAPPRHSTTVSSTRTGSRDPGIPGKGEIVPTVAVACFARVFSNMSPKKSATRTSGHSFGHVRTRGPVDALGDGGRLPRAADDRSSPPRDRVSQLRRQAAGGTASSSDRARSEISCVSRSLHHCLQPRQSASMAELLVTSCPCCRVGPCRWKLPKLARFTLIDRRPRLFGDRTVLLLGHRQIVFLGQSWSKPAASRSKPVLYLEAFAPAPVGPSRAGPPQTYVTAPPSSSAEASTAVYGRSLTCAVRPDGADAIVPGDPRQWAGGMAYTVSASWARAMVPACAQCTLVHHHARPHPIRFSTVSSSRSRHSARMKNLAK